MNKARNASIFVLLGLLVLNALAVLGANLNWFGAEVRTSHFATWGISGVLAEIVAQCWFVMKAMFRESKLALLICLPSDFASLEIRMIEWDDNECFIIGPKLKEKVKLVPSPVGPSLRVHFSAQLLDSLKDEEFLELKLKDKKGNRWEVRPFYLFENVQTVVPVGKSKKHAADYQVEAYE